MWHHVRPSDAIVSAFLAREAQLPFSYPQAGCSRDGRAPVGFTVDHNRVRLGVGEGVFRAARDALRAWRMFPSQWTEILPHHAPINEGQVVGVLVRSLGIWWTSSARIVYVIAETRRFCFAYGTLPGHVESGEERFSIEWLDDGSVWYDLRAFSRPRMWAARMAYPLTRGLQRRFARESTAAMVAATEALSHAAPGLSSVAHDTR